VKGAKIAVGMLIAGWIAILGVALFGCHGCGAPKPPPVVPAGEASCDQACANAAALPCGLSSGLCLRLCRGVATHNPAYPTCLYRATTCAEESACGGPDDDGGGINGPGGGRSGP
jgi:hypothetical protein